MFKDFNKLLKQAQAISANREKQLDGLLKQHSNLLDEKTVLFIKNTISSTKNGTLTMADMPNVIEQLKNMTTNVANKS